MVWYGDFHVEKDRLLKITDSQSPKEVFVGKD